MRNILITFLALLFSVSVSAQDVQKVEVRYESSAPNAKMTALTGLIEDTKTCKSPISVDGKIVSVLSEDDKIKGFIIDVEGTDGIAFGKTFRGVYAINKSLYEKTKLEQSDIDRINTLIFKDARVNIETLHCGAEETSMLNAIFASEPPKPRNDEEAIGITEIYEGGTDAKITMINETPHSLNISIGKKLYKVPVGKTVSATLVPGTYPMRFTGYGIKTATENRTFTKGYRLRLHLIMNKSPKTTTVRRRRRR